MEGKTSLTHQIGERGDEHSDKKEEDVVKGKYAKFVIR